MIVKLWPSVKGIEAWNKYLSFLPILSSPASVFCCPDPNGSLKAKGPGDNVHRRKPAGKQAGQGRGRRKGAGEAGRDKTQYA